MGKVAPMRMKIPPDAQVVPESPESPPPTPPIPSPEVPSPPPLPLGDLPSFMGFYTLDDFSELEQWVVDSKAARSQPDLRVEEPELSPNLRTFLSVMLGPQWELKLLHQTGEVLFDQLRANLAGYNQHIRFNRRQWLRLFPA